MPFLGSALGLTAMCSLRWGDLVAFDWNDLPVGWEFDRKFLKKVKSLPHALKPPPPHPRRHYIERCIPTNQNPGNEIMISRDNSSETNILPRWSAVGLKNTQTLGRNVGRQIQQPNLRNKRKTR